MIAGSRPVAPAAVPPAALPNMPRIRLHAAVVFLAASLTIPALAQPAGSPPVVADFAALYERQVPSVVAVQSVQRVKHPATSGLPEGHPPLDPFHRRSPAPGGAPREFERQAEGSGFIVSADGYLVTNAHVVEGASEVVVRLADNREFRAKVVGADKPTDVALLRIDATGLPAVTIGDPEKLRVGEWVVAIGKPLGLANSMTAGIVSAKGRDLPDEDLVPFIQTDAAVNPGSSGGPLINLRGEVVGITSMIYSQTGGYMGISFAIPIDIAMSAVAQLRDKGRVTRGRIGVEIAEVDRETAESFGLPAPTGALVNAVEQGGPAEKAGIEAGDIVLAIDGRDVTTVAELPRIVTGIAPGTTATLTVWRANARRQIPVVVAEQAAEDATPQPARADAKPNRLGLVLAELAPAQRRELGVAAGVRVERVDDGVRANLRPGDVVLSLVVRGHASDATSVERVEALVASLPKGTPVTLRVARGEQSFFVSLRVRDDG